MWPWKSIELTQKFNVSSHWHQTWVNILTNVPRGWGSQPKAVKNWVFPLIFSRISILEIFQTSRFPDTHAVVDPDDWGFTYLLKIRNSPDARGRPNPDPGPGVLASNIVRRQSVQWEVYLLFINHSSRSFNPSLGWYLIIPVAAVFSWDDLYVRSFSDAPLPIIVICRDQWEDSICQIMAQAPVLMLSPVPVTIIRLYPDLDIQVLNI